MKKIIMAGIAGVLIFAMGAGVAFGVNRYSKPKSVLHIVTVRWKASATAEQKQAALDGVEKTMAASIPGLKNVWIKTMKVQGDNYNAVFAMEFENEAAFKGYADHAAHKEWEKVYLAIRDESTTHDVTN